MPAPSASEHIIGFGKKLSYCTTVNGSYTDVYNTRNITAPQTQLGSAEITNDNSPNRTKARIPGLYDPGTVSFTYVYSRTQFAALQTLLAGGTSQAGAAAATLFWKITYADGSVLAFQGYLTKNDLPAELEGELVSEGEIQATTVPTFTAGAGS